MRTIEVTAPLFDAWPGEANRRDGKLARAELFFAAVAESRSRVLGAKNSSTAFGWYSLGQVQVDQEKYAAAEAPLRTAVSTFGASPEGWGRYGSQSLLGESLAGQRRYAAAESLLLSGYEGLRRFQKTVPVAERALFAKTEGWILQLYRDSNRPEKVTEWRARFERDDSNATATH